MMPSYVWGRVQFLPIMPSTTGIQVWQGWWGYCTDLILIFGKVEFWCSRQGRGAAGDVVFYPCPTW